jgi:hypothetical protein
VQRAGVRRTGRQLVGLPDPHPDSKRLVPGGIWWTAAVAGVAVRDAEVREQVASSVPATATAAIAATLYQRTGFTEIGAKRGYYQPSGTDAIVIRLTFAAPRDGLLGSSRGWITIRRGN